MSDPVFFDHPPLQTRRDHRRVERRRVTKRRRTIVSAAAVGAVAVGIGFGVSLSRDGAITPVLADGESAARFATSASDDTSVPGSAPGAGVAEAPAPAPVSPAPAAAAAPAAPEAPAAPDPESPPAAPAMPPAPAPVPTTAPATATAATVTAPPPPPAPTPMSTPAAQQQVLDLVNAERAAAGCGSVTMNDALVAAAQGHAEDMKAKGYFSHTGQDGDSPFDRMEAAGYDYRAAGENIARGQRDAPEVMAGWLDSPGHRANILNCTYEEIGVGYAEGGKGPWWVQNFGSR